MSRFAGIKNNNIFIVSDTSFTHETYQVIEIPPELDSISLKDLISDYKFKNNKIVLKRERKPANELKIAIVSNWKMRCGISTYAENLVPEIIKHVKDYKFFIEKNEIITGDIHEVGKLIIPNEKIISCWKRGEPLNVLIKELKSFEPDIIWFQHEFGLWPNASYWLSMMSQLSEYRIIVTMHSIFHHKDKTIVEAAMPEIISHLEGGKKVLKEEKCISGKVHVIPHGCYPYDNERLWNFYKTEHTIIQTGFLFKYKGWGDALKTVANLKKKYPDVFFTGLCSESPYCKTEHQLYYDELIELIENLKIQDNVCLIRGYQSDQVLDSYLKINRVALFPYISHPAHEVFGASGAARLSMSKGLPVITSSINHFSDLNSIKADTPEQMSFEIDKLFSDSKLWEKQVEKQKQFIENNGWDKIAAQYIEIFEQ